MPTENQPTYQLSGFDPVVFLKDYWQRKPVLLRQALPNWQNPVSADELAGLALEDMIESRLLQQTGSTGDKPSLSLEHGPFREEQLQRLGKQPWTLLVQAVDHYREDVALLLEYFNFIPRWQIDDIMVSCASSGGGVGPHYDRYDVFLLQGLGRREWKLGQRCNDNTPLAGDTQLNQLAEFATNETHVLEPGDILYIPPYIAHWGTALDDECMTYSVGFRSPALAEIVESLGHHVAARLGEAQRLRVEVSGDGTQPGSIDAGTIQQLASVAGSLLSDKDAITQWFGQWVTQAKYSNDMDETNRHDAAIEAEDCHYNSEELQQQLQQRATLVRNPAIRFAYAKASAGSNVNTGSVADTDDGQLCLFIDGELFDIGGSSSELAIVARQLCNKQRFHAQELLPWFASARGGEIITYCFDRGFIYFDDD